MVSLVAVHVEKRKTSKGKTDMEEGGFKTLDNAFVTKEKLV